MEAPLTAPQLTAKHSVDLCISMPVHIHGCLFTLGLGRSRVDHILIEFGHHITSEQAFDIFAHEVFSSGVE